MINAHIVSEYIPTKDELLILTCLKCRKNNKKHFKKHLINRFANTYEFCDADINTFCLMLRKDFHPYEYMDSWKSFDETSLPEKEDFYSNLDMEEITDADFKHAKNVWKDFKIKNLGEYHDLHVQNDILLLADVFESFRNMCIEIYELDPVHYLLTPGLVWQACLKKTEIELVLISDIDMLLTVEKEIRGGICHVIHRYDAANNKYMQENKKDNELSHIMYLDANNLYLWEMSQKLPVNSFKRKKNMLKEFIKNYDENNDKGYVLEVDVKYSKRLNNLYNDLPFLPERMKIKSCNNLVGSLCDKNN